MEDYPRYRAPQHDGEVALFPPLTQLVEQLPTAALHAAPDVEIGGQSLQQLAADARQQALEAAVRYTSAYCNVDRAAARGPAVFTGHQPELVHPGVWLKNFLAAGLARRCGGIAVNLLIDGDQCVRPAVRVPTGAVERPRVKLVRFDQLTSSMPYEERDVVDPAMWRSFATRVRHSLAPLASNAFIEEWWPDAVSGMNDEPLLGRRLAQARHRTELAWGSVSLELPQSLVCQTPSFRWFVVALLAELERFRADYNQAMAEYRSAHHIRNQAQPLPDLAENGEWLEAPFWIWRTEAPVRRPLYVRRRADSLELSDLAGVDFHLPTSSERDLADACEELARWESAGVKIRSRALTTTLFARMFLSDLFIHGIGGGKYDQVTDEICRKFLGAKPPPFTVATGTLRLGIEQPANDGGRPLELRQQIRSMKFHPEKWIDNAKFHGEDLQAIQAAKAQKQRAVETPKTPQTAAARHQQIQSANKTLGGFLQSRRRAASATIADAERAERAAVILSSREYAFCLFSRERLQDFLLDFWQRLS